MPRGSEARVALVLAWALLALSLGDWWSRIAANEGGFRDHVFIADFLAWPTVIEDTLVRGNPFAGSWHLTPAPYLVPEGVLFLGARAVFSSIEARQYAVIVADVLWLALGLAWLCARIDRELAALGPAVAAIAVNLGVQGIEPFCNVLFPTCHVGVAILSAPALGLLLETPDRRWKGPALALLMLAGTASDTLMPLFLGGSAALLLSSATARGGWRGALPLASRLLWCTAGAMLGWAIGRSLPFPDRDHHTTRLADLGATALQVWPQWLAFPPSFRWTLGLGTVALLALALRARSERRRVAALALLGGVLATLVGVLGTGNLGEGGWSRYLLWPVLAAMLGTFLCLGRAAVVNLGALAVGAGLLIQGALGAPPLAFPLEAPPSRYRDEVACLDQLARFAGATGVVAGYWQSKPIALFSRTGLSPAQYGEFEAGLQPSLHITSRSWFWPRSGFALVVATDLNRGLLDAELGRDFVRQQCGGFEVRVYRGQGRSRLNAFVAREAPLVGAP